MNDSKIVLRSLFLVYCQMCFSVNGYDIYDVDQLTDIFNITNYDTYIRPIFNQSEALQLQVQLGVSSILDIDFGTGKLEYTGNILARWQNEKLIWNSTQYGGLTKLKLDMAQIWNPDIAQLDMVGEFASSTFAFVENTGMVTMVINRELYSLCEYIDNYYECSVVLFSSNPLSEVNIVPLTDSVNLANFKGNGTWNWDTTSVYTDTIHIAEVNSTNVEISCLVNTIRVKSAAMSSLVHKYIPLFLITCTCLFSFFVPLNCGERISFSVTVFLALVFLQILIADELPKHSSKIGRISIYMTITLCQSIMSVVMSAYLYQLSVEKERPIPNWLYKRADKAKRERYKPSDKPSSVKLGSNCGSTVETDNEAVDTSNSRTKNPEIEITWFDAAERLDSLFSYVQYFILGLSIVVIELVFQGKEL